MGLEVQHGVGPDFLQDREIGLIGLQQFTQGAFFDGGVGPDLGRVLPENGSAAARQVDGRHPQAQAVQLHFQVLVLPQREGRIGLQMEGNPHPSGSAEGQEGFGIRRQGGLAFFPFQGQPVQTQGEGIGRQAAAEKQAVHSEGNPAFRDIV